MVVKMNAKGWNVYHTQDSDTIHDSVPRGPVSQLEVGKQYSAFPIVSNPTDVQQVLNSFQYVMQNYRFPQIMFNKNPMLLVPFDVRDNNIVVRVPFEVILSHTEFLESLETLESIVNMN